MASKVASGASSALSSLARATSSVGGPLATYARVGMAFGREVARRERLGPPDLGQLGAAGQEVRQIWQRVRTTNVADYTPLQLARAGLLVVEVFGFFVIGEMVGRRQIVGYKH